MRGLGCLGQTWRYPGDEVPVVLEHVLASSLRAHFKHAQHLELSWHTSKKSYMFLTTTMSIQTR